MRTALAVLAAAIVLPAQPLAGQELDVTRRTYTFLDSRLDVDVLADAPGVIQVIRGERGRIEVAARSRDGFAGFGLGGTHTRQLRLTAVGSEAVQYLVVVPENVSVRVRLPTGASASLAPRQALGTWSWAGDPPAASDAVGSPPASPVGPDNVPLPTTLGGLFLAHRSTWAPTMINIPELAAVRSLSLRFEGADFRIAASRPLGVSPGDRNHMEIRVDGEPLDLVLFIPRGRAAFQLRSGDTRIAESVGDRPRAICGNVVIQSPTPSQAWLTFYPQHGRLDCR
ncbi:MAG TPA: hypothetical protein VK929_17350 [Longimicrobiales bacterium]|nr:hypothetical protein [Longimicrobiales bacterium]